jgi:sporulation protein YlmC with PRC-barrel domain
MNSQISPDKIEPGKHNLRIKVLLDKLRNKLKNFAVLGKGGYYLGEVKDVKLDRERQLNLVIAQNDSEIELRWVLLRSKHIQQVDSGTKMLFVDITKAEVAQLPEYALPKNSVEPAIVTSPSSPQTSVPQVIDQNLAPVNGTSSSNLLDVKANVVPETHFPAPDTQNLAASEYHQEEHNMSIEESLLSHETEVVEEEVIRLLEERLIVDRNKRKVGEVIVRKIIETRMVQVPVRYEKLIVEQVNPEHKHLAEIILDGEDLNDIDISELTSGNANGSLTTKQTNEGTVSGEFKSPKSASLFLNAIALQRHHGCAKVRVELVLEDPQLEKTYEQWFERCTGS